jgi:uroporphyrinogen-III decarboxylase
MAEEPEAVYDFFQAITDNKVKQIEYIARYYKPDFVLHADDIATERSPFMSPDAYRRLIKPMHKQICDAIKANGLIPVQHTCGHVEMLVDDFVETGAAAWSSVQPMNDVAGLLKKYQGKFSFEGGYNGNGPAAQPSAPVEDLVAEIERCYREYASYPNFSLYAFIIGSSEVNQKGKFSTLVKTANRLRFEKCGGKPANYTDMAFILDN